MTVLLTSGSATIAQDLGTRLRDIPAALNIAERSAHGIVTGLNAAGYVVRQKDSRSCIWRFRFYFFVAGLLSVFRSLPFGLALGIGQVIERPPVAGG